MTAVFIFSLSLLSLLYGCCSGVSCVGEWSTDTTRYRTIKSKEDSYLHVSCKYPIFKVDGQETIKCVGGELPIYLPQCVLRKGSCSPLKPPVYGSMKCTTTPPEVGSSCTFDCKSSHYLRGTETRICTENLLWTGSVARCFLRAECPEPPPLLQGTVDGCSPERKPRYKDTCSFRCNEGFRLVGPPRLKCRVNGRLTDAKGRRRFPRCEPIAAGAGATSADEDLENRSFPDRSTASQPSPDRRTVSPSSRPSCRLRNGFCAHRCHQEGNAIRCSCSPGYLLSADGKSCALVVRNPGLPATPPQHGTRPASPTSGLSCRVDNGHCSHLCHQEPNGIRCSCRPGYLLSPDQKTCVDADECLDHSMNKCQHACQNTNGGYTCSCRAGFVSPDGFRCEGCRANAYRSPSDVSCRECPAHSHTQGEEKTSISDCICHSGFIGNPGQGVPCTDIDECSDGKNFGCSHSCINTPGSAHCACALGYQLKEDGKRCEDIDECSIQNGGCDGVCRNTAGNFTCFCPAGYVAAQRDRYSCDDVDECASKNGGCSGACVNFKGGFHCVCSEGYYLHPDGKNCIPVHCSGVPVPHHATLRCKNSADSKEKDIYHPGEMTEDKRFPVGATCRIKCDKGYDFGDSHPQIVCQNDGKWNALLPVCRVLQCPPLSPPPNGDVHPPACKEGTSTVKQKCFFTCPPGYRIAGQEVVTCRNNLTWTQRRPTQCMPETELSISCPDDSITVELKSDEGYAEMQLTSPRTALAEGPVRVSPEWVSLDRTTVFPAGETEVTFSVTGYNKTAECSLSVIVLDKHPPVFPDCPDTLLVTSSPAVNWTEPIPQDNVGIATVFKNLEPDLVLRPGLHFVEYVARDFAGNTGQCLFHINVTAGGCRDLADPENGEANCHEWTSGKICQPSCFANYTRPSDELFACDESGTWTPSDVISPCLPICSQDEVWSSELQKCLNIP